MKRNTSGAVRAMETEEEEKLIGAIRRERRSRVFCIDTPRWTERGERSYCARSEEETDDRRRCFQYVPFTSLSLPTPQRLTSVIVGVYNPRLKDETDDHLSCATP